MVIFGLINSDASPEMHRGAFVVFCTKTLRFSYAYPSSPNAVDASRGKSREVAERMLAGSYEADSDGVRRAVQLLQFMAKPTGTANAFDCVGWLDIAYEMDRQCKETILANVGADSEMSDALRLR